MILKFRLIKLCLELQLIRRDGRRLRKAMMGFIEMLMEQLKDGGMILMIQAEITLGLSLKKWSSKEILKSFLMMRKNLLICIIIMIMCFLLMTMFNR